MISQVVSKYLGSRAKNVYVLGSARFDFCIEENLLTVPTSVWRKFLAAFNFAAHATYAAFVLLRLLQYRYLNRNEVLDDQSKIFLEFACLVHLVPPFVCHLCFFLREEDVAMFVNQFMTYHRNIEGSRHFLVIKLVNSEI